MHNPFLKSVKWLKPNFQEGQGNVTKQTESMRSRLFLTSFSLLFLIPNSFCLLFRCWAKPHFTSFHTTYILWLSWHPRRDTDKEKTVKDIRITVRMEIPTACVEREETGLPTDREIYTEQMSFRRKCHKNTFSLLALILGLEKPFSHPSAKSYFYGSSLNHQPFVTHEEESEKERLSGSGQSTSC